MEEGRVLGGQAQKSPPKPKNHPNHAGSLILGSATCV